MKLMPPLDKYRPERQLDVTVDCVKRLILFGDERYTDAFRRGDVRDQMYWDGYIRALHHVLEAEDE